MSNELHRHPTILSFIGCSKEVTRLYDVLDEIHYLRLRVEGSEPDAKQKVQSQLLGAAAKITHEHFETELRNLMLWMKELEKTLQNSQ